MRVPSDFLFPLFRKGEHPEKTTTSQDVQSHDMIRAFPGRKLSKHEEHDHL